MGLGESGQVEATPQTLVDGKWKRAPNARSALRWRARCYVRDYSGVRREVCRFGKTKREAEREAGQAVEELLKGAGEPIRSSAKLMDAGTLWLERIARSKLSARTLSDYRYSYERYVAQGSLANLTLAQITPQQIRLLLEGVADKYGDATAKLTKTVVSSILQAAVDDGVLFANPARQVRPVSGKKKPKVERDHSRAFTREERDRLITYAYSQCIGEMHPRTRRKAVATANLIALMAGTGMRIEEARSLLWEDVDLENGRYIVRGTKSDKALRVAGGPVWLSERLGASVGIEGRVGLVVPSPGHVGRPMAHWDQSNSASAVRKVLDDCGFTWAVPHTFRRTVVTMLHEAGVPLVKIADQVGHEDPALTARIYIGRDLTGERSGIAEIL